MPPRRRTVASESGGSGSDSDYAPEEEGGVQDEDSDFPHDDDDDFGGIGESGFSTAGTSGSDEDDGSLFEDGMDPLDLLSNMAAQQAGEDETAMQPFEVLRQRPWAVSTAAGVGMDGNKRRGRKSGAVGSADQDGADGEAGPSRSARGDDEDGSSSGGDGGGRAQRGRRRGGRDRSAAAAAKGGGGAYGNSDEGSSGGEGVDANDVMFDDPVAAKLGLSKPLTRRARGSRGARGGSGRRSRTRAGQKKKPRNAMPEEVSRMLGQANMAYATSRYQEAIDLLLQVIKACPSFPDPYHTLGLLHEATGNPRKALDFFMIAAHLSPKDLELWRRLAALSSEMGFWRQAIYCFTRILHRDRTDLDSRWDRAVLYAQVGDVERAMSQLESMSKLRPGDAEVPKVLVRLYHRTSQPQKAIAVLEKHMEEYPDAVDLTHVNMLAELLIQQGAFEETHTLLQKVAANQSASEPLPLDLAVKAGMCLAHMGRLEAADEQLVALLAEGPEQYSDLFLDVGVSLMTMKQHDRAITYLSRLVEVPELDAPSLWARLLECHRRVGDVPAAVRLYADKLQGIDRRDPRHMETCLQLCELHVEAGQPELAAQLLAGLDADPTPREDDPLAAPPAAAEDEAGSPPPAVRDDDAASTALELDLRRGALHLKLGQPDAFIATLAPLVALSVSRLQADMAVVNHPDMPKDVRRSIQRQQMLYKKGRQGEGAMETGSVFKGTGRRDRRMKHILEADRAALSYLSDMSDGEGDEGGGGGGQFRGGASCGILSEPQHYGLLVTLVQTMKEQHRTQDARDLLEGVGQALNAAKKWLPRGQRDMLRLALASAWLRLGDLKAASMLCKILCAGWPYSMAVWEQYCGVLAATAGAGGWAGFVGGLRRKYAGSLPLMVMQGHVHAVSRHYGEAVSEYQHASRFLPDEPLLLLCLATCHVSMATGRRTTDRHRSVLTGFAYMQSYAANRGNEQESAYNTARALHELGMVHLAVQWYERALAAPPPAPPLAPAGSPAAADPAPLGPHDLRCEAAHNLALIYMASGAKELARRVLMKYRVR